MDPLLGFAVSFACVVASVLGVSASAPKFPPRALGGLAVPVAVLAAARAGWLGLAGVPDFALVPVAVSLLVAGTLVGATIGGRVQHAGHLSLVAYITSVADLASVLAPQGVTAQIVASRPTLAVFAISWAIPGHDALEPILGVGDVTMTALYFLAARNLGLPLRRTWFALLIGYVAVLLVLVVGQRAVPALPFLGVAFVLAHPVTFRIRAEDRRAAVLGVVLASAAGAWAVFRAFFA
ncbi:MAG: hypothetical protein R3A78_04390 [Polyangiales bacterium]